jgi:hypothetical protein
VRKPIMIALAIVALFALVFWQASFAVTPEDAPVTQNQYQPLW